MDWQASEARNHFSELITKALTKGPQRITRRGETVLITAEKKKPRRRKSKYKDFKDALFNGPSFEGVDLTRNKSLDRDIKF